MNNEYRFRVGDAVICIKCPTEEFARSMREYLGYFSSETNFDIRLELKIKKHFKELPVPDSMFINKKVSGNKFTIGNKLVNGYFKPDSGTGKIIVKEILTRGLLRRVFEQVLYQAYYSVSNIKNVDSVLVHSAGVIYEGRGFLFTGASGTGKTTIARLSREFHVLNDEICLLEFKKDRVILHGTPFNGYFRDKKPGSADLDTIFIINHGDNHLISIMKKSDAVKNLAKEIIPPVGLEEAMRPDIFSRMIDTASRISDHVPMKSLHFIPDSRFWNKIRSMSNDN